MDIKISKDIYDRLIERLNGRIYVDATDILDSVLRLEPIPEQEYKNYEKVLLNICSIPSTTGCKHLYGLQDGIGLVLYHKAPLYYGQSGEVWLGIWKNPELIEGYRWYIFDTSLVYVSCYGALVYENKEPLFFRYIDSKMYCGIVNTWPDVAKSPKIFIKKYIETKKWQIIYKLKDKFNVYLISNRLNKAWESLKKKYKEFKRFYQKYPERAMLNNSSKIDDLREAGWKFYENCQACEPKEPAIKGKYRLEFQAYFYGENSYWTVKKDNRMIARIPLHIFGFGLSDKSRYVIELDDLRVVKYLRKLPHLFTTKFEEIPYFKWAAEKVKQLMK